MEWGDALSFCKTSFDAKLVEVESASESTFIEHESRNHAGLATGVFWLGGSDVVVEGEWEWMTSHSRLTYSHWAPGQPSNDANREHCLNIHSGFLYRWNDAPCTDRHWFICEKSIESATDGNLVG
ncbi:CD209 antigen-like protein C [Crassostrea virginica]